MATFVTNIIYYRVADKFSWSETFSTYPSKQRIDNTHTHTHNSNDYLFIKIKSLYYNYVTN